ncbi:hypothetical protein ACWEBX_03400 [Streptomyces sp. NPDC005070]
MAVQHLPHASRVVPGGDFSAPLAPGIRLGAFSLSLEDRMANTPSTRQAQTARLHCLIAQAGVLVCVDQTLPAHCPARVSRFGRHRTLLRVAPGTSPMERIAFVEAAIAKGVVR